MAELDYEEQSAHFIGWQLGRIAEQEHLHWIKRFVDTMRDQESIAFAQLVRASRYVGNNVEDRLRSRLTAFERGLERGARFGEKAHLMRKRPVGSRALPAWGRSGSVGMLLHDAIDRLSVVRFYYRGRMRIAEPHVLGTKDGRLQILTFQVGGESSRGGLPNWRRFFVDEISHLETTGETFAGPRLTWGRHSEFDRQIAFVRQD